MKNLIFVLAVSASGWVGLALDRLIGNPPQQGLGMLLFILAPFTAALLLAERGVRIRSLGLKPDFRRNAGWYAFALGADLVLIAVILAFGMAAGGIDSRRTAAALPAVVAAALGSMPALLLKNVLEEVGWRGFLSPRLEARWGSRNASIATGIVWGTWHLPYWLIMTPRESWLAASPYVPVDPTPSSSHGWLANPESSSSVILIGTLLTVAAAWLALIGLSFLYGRIRRESGSVWPVVLMHAMNNAAVAALIANVDFGARAKWLFSPVMNALPYLILLLAVNLGLAWYVGRWRHGTDAGVAAGVAAVPDGQNRVAAVPDAQNRVVTVQDEVNREQVVPGATHRVTADSDADKPVDA